ncbi:hypothetical protein [Nostoc sp. UHCC 0252]|uniref:hypothetical protein n=1 Tax=Nostoc sp. UHCC 0252 TaxID=3110241 RepID=UPI002B203070|nr:hypothetical protein [Nostoc sp. UHCC 0252]MEA5603869.1 hypothetical protein [Nostoc sp. UHCC 0252]
MFRFPPLKSYGVHTSLKIPPTSTWFRHLALGLRRSLWKLVRSVSQTSDRFNSRDYVITSLRYHCARNDNLRGL